MSDIKFLEELTVSSFSTTGAGIQWSTLDKGASVDDDFAMLHIIIMLLVDTVLYMMLTIYIEGVFPGEYGTPLKWYFPFTVSGLPSFTY